MNAIFDALPGIEAPVGPIAPSLARMWDDRADAGQPAPAADDAKATQVNCVLHLGFATMPDDALRQFRTTVAPADALSFLWPNPAAVRDLAFARTLPVRQSVGQFLSRYAPARLIDGLQTVTVAHAPALAAEGRALLRWAEDRLGACNAPAAEIHFPAVPCDATQGSPKQVLSDGRPGDMGETPMPCGTGVSPVGSSGRSKPDWRPTQGRALELRFDYTGPSRFSWRGDDATGAAQFDADFGTGRTELPAGTSLLTPELALGEAMFS